MTTTNIPCQFSFSFAVGGMQTARLREIRRRAEVVLYYSGLVDKCKGCKSKKRCLLGTGRASEETALGLGGSGGRLTRSASDAFPHGPPTCLPQKRSRPADGAFSESKLGACVCTLRRSVEQASSCIALHLRGCQSDGLTTVGEREPLRVNAALERLLRHLFVR